MRTLYLFILIPLFVACAPTPAPQIVLVEERPDASPPEDATAPDVELDAPDEAPVQADDPVEASAPDVATLEAAVDEGAPDVELEAEAGCGITCEPWEVCGYVADTNEASVPTCQADGSCYAFPENCGGMCLGVPPDPCGLSQGDPFTVFVTCPTAGPPASATCKAAGQYYCCEP